MANDYLSNATYHKTHINVKYGYAPNVQATKDTAA